MDKSVRLDLLPDDLTFPPELLDRVAYDASRKLLSFRGFMSKADFDRLCQLSENWSYRRSLEELFRLCSLEPENPPANRLAAVFARLLPRKQTVAR